MHLLMLLSAVALAVSGEDSCTLINWWKHKDSIDIIGNQLSELVKGGLQAGPVAQVLKAMDPYKLNGDLIEQLKMEIKQRLIYDFKIGVDLDHLSLAGFSTVKLVPIASVNSRELRFAIEFDSIDVLGRANVILNQETQTGCEANEEIHVGLCYKKCSILTNGRYNERISPTTCVTRSPRYRRWSRGSRCSGNAVNGKDVCPTSYYRICFTELLQVKAPGMCRPGKLEGTFDIKLKKVRLETTIRTEIPVCTDDAVEGEDLHKDIACVARAIAYIALGAANSGNVADVLPGFVKFKSMIARLEFSEIKLVYDESSVIGLNVKGDGFIGWVVERVHKYLMEKLNSYPTLISDIINSQLLDTLVKPKANVLIDGILAGNKCRE